MRPSRDEARLIDAARRFCRSAARVFLLVYLTGGVLLLPGIFPAHAPEASERFAGLSVSDEPRATRERDALVVTRSATVVRGEPPKPRARVVKEGETLDLIAKEFGVKAETIAYNNGIKSRSDLAVGATLTIPPVDGALVAVKDGDTVESIAARFGVDAKTIMEANRLYFEPHNFGVGRDVLVPVPTARYPGFELADVIPPAAVARVVPVSRGPGVISAPASGRLMWPVGGTITQYYHGGHPGVDIAAPYGSAIGASDAGTVSAVGWVAIGGLRVCVRHDSGLETCYYHTSATYVGVGQRVVRGQIIAAIGLTGVTTGPHVHWEANLGGRLVNPLAY